MTETAFQQKYGPVALVTGAAFGIGRAFAFELAQRGLDLLLIDIEHRALERMAREVRSASPDVKVETLAADLSNSISVERVAEAAIEAGVSLLVNNAGSGQAGYFEHIDLESHLNVLDLNVRAPLVLTHRLLPSLREKERAGVIFMASLTALGGAPGVAHYSATKSYVLNLAEALFGELEEDGIDVLSVMPGLTRTNATTVGMTAKEIQQMKAMDPEEVVNCALNALGTGPSVIPGRGSRWTGFALRYLPRRSFLRRQAKRLHDSYQAEAE